DNRPFSDLVFGRPTGLPARSRYQYLPDLPMVPEHAAANLRNRSHTITAYVDGVSDGMLLSMGNVLGGFAFFVRAGRLTYVHNFVALEEHRIESSVPIPTD